MKSSITYILTFFLLMIHTASFAQKDSVLLAGNIRHYGDSVVLRWNTFSSSDYLHLYRSEAIIERRSSEDGPYEIVSRQKAIPAEQWNIGRTSAGNPEIVAAAGIYQLIKESEKPAGEIGELTERYETMNFLWANVSLYADLYPFVANKANLRYIDLNPPATDRAEYRLYLMSDEFISDTLTFIAEGRGFTPEYPGDFTAIENEGFIDFSIPAIRKYSAYYIQRSEKDKDNYQNLNTAPIVIPANQGSSPMVYWTDSVKNYTPYSYRIFAIDLFGNKSKYSNIITAMGRDFTPPSLITGFKITENSNKTLTLSWNKPSGKQGEKGIAIYLKQQSEEPFQALNTTLLSVNENRYTFKIIPDQTDHYFQLRLYDTAGNYSIAENFYQLIDSIPPAKPVGFSAKADSNGVVTLIWNRNKEKDLKGYLIFSANSDKVEMSGIVNRPLNDTFYRDTLSLKMLNRNVYYRIQAVDKRFNQSPLSDLIRVLRPDKLPPVAPVIRNYLVTDTAIKIYWTPSSSLDVSSHFLHKKNLDNGQVKTISLKPDSVFSDKDVEPGQYYEYSFTAIDSSGNLSQSSNSARLKTYKLVYVAPVKNFGVLYDSALGGVKIIWDYPSTNISRIQLYKGKSIDAVSSTPFKIKPEQKQYLDTHIEPDKVYHYAIKIYLKNDTQTILNTPIAVFTGKTEP